MSTGDETDPRERVLSEEFRARYEILEVLGEGGMGRVYRALQRDLRRQVAIKFTHVTSDVARKRFVREGQAQAGLSHPNILPVLASGEEDGAPYLVFEIVEGETLERRIERSGPLPIGLALEIGRQCAEALAHVHARGLLHRDFKSANVLLAESHQTITAKVCDFGLVVESTGRTRLTESGVVMGTPSCMAPELINGGEPSARSDIYALGCVLFEAFTGRPPYGARLWPEVLAAHLAVPVPIPSETRPELPDTVDAIVRSCLAKDPAQRPQEAEALARALSVEVRRAEARAGLDSELQSRRTLQVVIPAGGGRPAVDEPFKSRRGQTSRQPAGNADATTSTGMARTAIAAGTLSLLGVIAAISLWNRSPAPRSTRVPATPPPVTSPGVRVPLPRAAPAPLAISVGPTSIRLEWTPAASGPSEVRFGEPGKQVRTLRPHSADTIAVLTRLRPDQIQTVGLRWTDGRPTEELRIRTLRQGGDTAEVGIGGFRSNSYSWEICGDRLLFFSLGDRGLAATVRESGDGGKTWRPARELSQASPDSSLRSAAMGREVWAALSQDVAADGRGHPAEIRLLHSGDAGKTWGEPMAIPSSGKSFVTGLLPHPDGLDIFHSVGTRLWRKRVRLPQARILLDEPIADFDGNARIAAARTADGIIHLVGRSTGSAPHLIYVRSGKGPSGWEAPIPFLDGKQDGDCPNAAVEGNTLYLLWTTRAPQADGRQLHLARSFDAGRSWDGPRSVPGSETALTADEDGGTRAAIGAAGGVLAITWQSERRIIETEIEAVASWDRGESFPRRESARVRPIGKIMGARLLLLPDTVLQGCCLASLEVYRVARFSSLLPARFTATRSGVATSIR